MLWRICLARHDHLIGTHTFPFEPDILNRLTFPVLQVLSDGRFHSGQALAQHFEVTRSTIWNILQELQAMGVSIFSVAGRGYRLANALYLLDAEKVRGLLGTMAVPMHFELHDALDSTNRHLMTVAANHDWPMQQLARCVATQYQTSGRGRRGRTWHSALGESLTFSVLWRFQQGAAALSGLSLAVGVALVRALHHIGVPQVGLKWPNDLVVMRQTENGHQSQKLAGILIELQGDFEGPSNAVIGVGINLALSAQSLANIEQAATDCQALLGQRIDPNLLLALLLDQLSLVLRQFERYGFEPLREEWLQHHAFHQRMVRMLMPDGSVITGQITGIETDGALCLQTPQGVQRFNAGEISLRGLP